MRKSLFSKLLPGMMIAVTVLAIMIVLLVNFYPPLDDMVVIDGLSPAGAVSGLANSSASAVTESSNSHSDGVSGSTGSDVLGSTALSASESTDSSASGGESFAVSSVEVSAGGKININTASVSELMALNGIGEARANAIVEYRETHGAFSSIEDLMKVSGIGEKTLEKNRDLITV